MILCSCLEEIGRFGDLLQEIAEFVESPNLEELSDVFFAFARLGRRGYRGWMPGIGRHLAKIELRMQEYGCTRSRRNRCHNL